MERRRGLGAVGRPPVIRDMCLPPGGPALAAMVDAIGLVVRLEEEPTTLRETDIVRRFGGYLGLARWTEERIRLRNRPQTVCEGHRRCTGVCFDRLHLYRLYQKEFGIDREATRKLYRGMLLLRLTKERHRNSASYWLRLGPFAVLGLLLASFGGDPGAVPAGRQEERYCCTAFTKAPRRGSGWRPLGP